MTFNVKVCLVADSLELVDRQADIDLYDAVALCAGEVMVMRATTDAIVMRAVRKLNTIQQSHVHQHLNRTIDSGTSHAWLVLP